MSMEPVEPKYVYGKSSSLSSYIYGSNAQARRLEVGQSITEARRDCESLLSDWGHLHYSDQCRGGSIYRTAIRSVTWPW